MSSHYLTKSRDENPLAQWPSKLDRGFVGPENPHIPKGHLFDDGGDISSYFGCVPSLSGKYGFDVLTRRLLERIKLNMFPETLPKSFCLLKKNEKYLDEESFWRPTKHIPYLYKVPHSGHANSCDASIEEVLVYLPQDPECDIEFHPTKLLDNPFLEIAHCLLAETLYYTKSFLNLSSEKLFHFMNHNHVSAPFLKYQALIRWAQYKLLESTKVEDPVRLSEQLEQKELEKRGLIRDPCAGHSNQDNAKSKVCTCSTCPEHELILVPNYRSPLKLRQLLFSVSNATKRLKRPLGRFDGGKTSNALLSVLYNVPFVSMELNELLFIFSDPFECLYTVEERNLIYAYRFSPQLALTRLETSNTSAKQTISQLPVLTSQSFGGLTAGWMASLNFLPNISMSGKRGNQWRMITALTNSRTLDEESSCPAPTLLHTFVTNFNHQRCAWAEYYWKATLLNKYAVLKREASSGLPVKFRPKLASAILRLLENYKIVLDGSLERAAVIEEDEEQISFNRQCDYLKKMSDFEINLKLVTEITSILKNARFIGDITSLLNTLPLTLHECIALTTLLSPSDDFIASTNLYPMFSPSKREWIKKLSTLHAKITEVRLKKHGGIRYLSQRDDCIETTMQNIVSLFPKKKRTQRSSTNIVFKDLDDDSIEELSISHAQSQQIRSIITHIEEDHEFAAAFSAYLLVESTFFSPNTRKVQVKATPFRSLTQAQSLKIPIPNSQQLWGDWMRSAKSLQEADLLTSGSGIHSMTTVHCLDSRYYNRYITKELLAANEELFGYKIPLCEIESTNLRHNLVCHQDILEGQKNILKEEAFEGDAKKINVFSLQNGRFEENVKFTEFACSKLYSPSAEHTEKLTDALKLLDRADIRSSTDDKVEIAAEVCIEQSAGALNSIDCDFEKKPRSKSASSYFKRSNVLEIKFNSYLSGSEHYSNTSLENNLCQQWFEPIPLALTSILSDPKYWSVRSNNMIPLIVPTEYYRRSLFGFRLPSPDTIELIAVVLFLLSVISTVVDPLGFGTSLVLVSGLVVFFEIVLSEIASVHIVDAKDACSSDLEGAVSREYKEVDDENICDFYLRTNYKSGVLIPQNLQMQRKIRMANDNNFISTTDQQTEISYFKASSLYEQECKGGQTIMKSNCSDSTFSAYDGCTPPVQKMDTEVKADDENRTSLKKPLVRNLAKRLLDQDYIPKLCGECRHKLFSIRSSPYQVSCKIPECVIFNRIRRKWDNFTYESKLNNFQDDIFKVPSPFLNLGTEASVVLPQEYKEEGWATTILLRNELENRRRKGKLSGHHNTPNAHDIFKERKTLSSKRPGDHMKGFPCNAFPLVCLIGIFLVSTVYFRENTKVNIISRSIGLYFEAETVQFLAMRDYALSISQSCPLNSNHTLPISKAFYDVSSPYHHFLHYTHPISYDISEVNNDALEKGEGDSPHTNKNQDELVLLRSDNDGSVELVNKLDSKFWKDAEVSILKWDKNSFTFFKWLFSNEHNLEMNPELRNCIKLPSSSLVLASKIFDALSEDVKIVVTALLKGLPPPLIVNGIPSPNLRDIDPFLDSFVRHYKLSIGELRNDLNTWYPTSFWKVFGIGIRDYSKRLSVRSRTLLFGEYSSNGESNPQRGQNVLNRLKMTPAQSVLLPRERSFFGSNQDIPMPVALQRAIIAPLASEGTYTLALIASSRGADPDRRIAESRKIVEEKENQMLKKYVLARNNSVSFALSKARRAKSVSMESSASINKTFEMKCDSLQARKPILPIRYVPSPPHITHSEQWDILQAYGYRWNFRTFYRVVRSLGYEVPKFAHYPLFVRLQPRRIMFEDKQEHVVKHLKHALSERLLMKDDSTLLSIMPRLYYPQTKRSYAVPLGHYSAAKRNITRLLNDYEERNPLVNMSIPLQVPKSLQLQLGVNIFWTSTQNMTTPESKLERNRLHDFSAFRLSPREQKRLFHNTITQYYPEIVMNAPFQFVCNTLNLFATSMRLVTRVIRRLAMWFSIPRPESHSSLTELSVRSRIDHDQALPVYLDNYYIADTRSAWNFLKENARLSGTLSPEQLKEQRQSIASKVPVRSAMLNDLLYVNGDLLRQSTGWITACLHFIADSIIEPMIYFYLNSFLGILYFYFQMFPYFTRAISGFLTDEAFCDQAFRFVLVNLQMLPRNEARLAIDVIKSDEYSLSMILKLPLTLFGLLYSALSFFFHLFLSVIGLAQRIPRYIVYYAFYLFTECLHTVLYFQNYIIRYLSFSLDWAANQKVLIYMFPILRLGEEIKNTINESVCGILNVMSVANSNVHPTCVNLNPNSLTILMISRTFEFILTCYTFLNEVPRNILDFTLTYFPLLGDIYDGVWSMICHYIPFLDRDFGLYHICLLYLLMIVSIASLRRLWNAKAYVYFTALVAIFYVVSDLFMPVLYWLWSGLLNMLNNFMTKPDAGSFKLWNSLVYWPHLLNLLTPNSRKLGLIQSIDAIDVSGLLWNRHLVHCIYHFMLITLVPQIIQESTVAEILGHILPSQRLILGPFLGSGPTSTFAAVLSYKLLYPTFFSLKNAILLLCALSEHFLMMYEYYELYSLFIVGRIAVYFILLARKHKSWLNSRKHALVHRTTHASDMTLLSPMVDILHTVLPNDGKDGIAPFLTTGTKYRNLWT